MGGRLERSRAEDMMPDWMDGKVMAVKRMDVVAVIVRECGRCSPSASAFGKAGTRHARFSFNVAHSFHPRWTSILERFIITLQQLPNQSINAGLNLIKYPFVL